MIYKVSYVVVGEPNAGAIINLDTRPEAGKEIQIGEDTFEVLEAIDLMPPRGDFAYLHVTCKRVES